MAGRPRRVAGQCHAAGQTQVRRRSCCATAPGDWNALHRDLYGELVFPLQVVISLDEPGRGPHRRRVPARRAAAAGQSRGTATLIPHGHGAGLHHPRPAGAVAPAAGRRRPVRHGVVGRPLRRAATPSASSSTTRHEPEPTLLGADGAVRQRDAGRWAGTGRGRSTVGWTARPRCADRQGALRPASGCSSPTRPPRSPPATGRAATACGSSTGSGRPAVQHGIAHAAARAGARTVLADPGGRRSAPSTRPTAIPAGRARDRALQTRAHTTRALTVTVRALCLGSGGRI